MECAFSIEIYKNFRLMDLELAGQTGPLAALFRPIHALPPLLLQQHSPTLQSSFSLSPLSHQSHTLTLFPNVLLISHSSPLLQTPFAFLELTFDLKFQVIYESEKNVKSHKKGLRFLYDNMRTFTVYSASAILQAWTTCLSLQINQVGFHEMFKPKKKLGRGNFASVYEVERVTDRRRFAVKAFSKQSCFAAKNGKQSLINQLTIMRQLSSQGHQSILRLQGVFQSQNSIYVVLQILTGGQLFHRIKERNGCFSGEEVREFMFGLLSGLSHMHSQRIMHRDLKPENIMLRSNGSMSPVIVDYGLATQADVEKYLFFRCGTPGYVAPQIIALTENKRIEPQCDIFSAGVIFHVLLTKRPLFEGNQYDQVYRKNKQMKIDLQGQRYEGVDVVALSLLGSMLLVDPQQRISAADALNHPFFNGYERGSQEKVSSPAATSCGGVGRWGVAHTE